MISFSELTDQQLETWDNFRSQNPSLQSPYFTHQFIRTVARIRDDVKVLVISRDGIDIGFLPFESKKNGPAVPVGNRLSDWHGIISAPGTNFDSREIVSSTKSKLFCFDHLADHDAIFSEHYEESSTSPIINLDSGFDSYCESQRASGSKMIRQLRRKQRKMQREIGEIRFELEMDDPRILERVMVLKRKQCKRTGSYDFFSEDWAVRLVESLHAQKTSALSGVLSGLFANNELVAAHFGIRSGQTLHWWFPVYEQEFRTYSPGSLLLMSLAEKAYAAGITTIDLGKGDDPYKANFMNGALPLHQGCLVVPSIRGFCYKTQKWGKEILRMSSARRPLKVIHNAIRTLQRPGRSASSAN
jgi:CelD/BcsL family acetyltransferase involved in cellulose biosynthesis